MTRPVRMPLATGRLLPRDGRAWYAGREAWIAAERDPIGRAQRLFVAGAGLPRAWSGRRSWTVLEPDAGIGVNFLATLSQWREDAARPARLHYVAIVSHPLPGRDLAQALRIVGVPSSLADSLVQRWPLPLPGLHRLGFDGGRATLTLAFGNPLWLLPRLVVRADSLFIDAGRTPVGQDPDGHDRDGCDRDGYTAGRRDPDVPALLRQACARLRGQGCAVAAAPWPGLARTLQDAGLAVATHPAGRDLPATLIGTRTRSSGAARCDRADAGGSADAARDAGPHDQPEPAGRERRAMIIGAGLAGCAIAFALAQRGWDVTLLEEQAGTARGGSGQPMLAHHPALSPDDAPLSRLTRSALLLARSHYDPGCVQWRGRLQRCSPERAALLVRDLPAAFARAVTLDEARALSGAPLREGGVWLPMAGCADPRTLCDAWSAHAARRLFGQRVEQLVHGPEGWVARGPGGEALGAAPVVIVAAGPGSLGLVDLAPPARLGVALPLQQRFGAATIAQATIAPARCVLGGDGYALAIDDSSWLVGPVEGPDAPPEPSPAHAWRRFVASLDVADPGGWAPMTTATPGGRLLHTGPRRHTGPRLHSGPGGWRLSSRDHLPLIGAVPDSVRIATRVTALRRNDRAPMPRVAGLYAATAFGGRGLLWAVLAAEVLAAELDGEPAPLERDLLDAIDPSRFSRRAIRQAL
jgi:tRNA 5-methylaminomethyl-2-thiouridine biosynthesis bifunctional protein